MDECKRREIDRSLDYYLALSTGAIASICSSASGHDLAYTALVATGATFAVLTINLAKRRLLP